MFCQELVGNFTPTGQFLVSSSPRGDFKLPSLHAHLGRSNAQELDIINLLDVANSLDAEVLLIQNPCNFKVFAHTKRFGTLTPLPKSHRRALMCLLLDDKC